MPKLKRLAHYAKRAIVPAIIIKQRTMTIVNETAFKSRKAFESMRNRYPAYRLTSEGIEVHWFDFSNTDDLPFDLDTYYKCQLFIGDWANPFTVDIESINDEFEELDYDKLQKGVHELKGEHVTPSQKYKTYMYQNTLSGIFSIQGENHQKILYALYANLGVLGLLFLVVVGALI